MKGFSADIRTRRPTGRSSAGYSLIELMIALGILGTATLLIATAFPAAMMMNKESVHHTMGTIIAENALAICRTRLTHSQLTNPAGFTLDHQFQDITDLIPLAERAYPTPMGKPIEDPAYAQQVGSWWYKPEDWLEIPAASGEFYPASRYGWLVLARRVLPGWTPGNLPPSPLPNDYQFVILTYRKFNVTDRPRPDPSYPTGPAAVELVISVITTDTNGDILPPLPADGFDVDAPVIVRAGVKPSGEIETAVEIAYISEPAGTISNADGTPRRIISVEALTVNYTLGNESPVIGCYVVRTGLSP